MMGLFGLMLLWRAPALLSSANLNLETIVAVNNPSSVTRHPSSFARDVTRFHRGEAYARAGWMEAAIVEWRLARAAPYFLQRGLALRHDKKWDAAAEALQTAVHIEPNDAALQTTLGHFYWEWGKPDEARAVLHRALALETKPYERTLLQGEVSELDGRLDEAQKIFSEALRAQPSRPEAYVQLSDLLSAQGKPADAIAVLTDGLARTPPTLALYLRLGVALTHQREFDAADRVFDQAQRVDANSDEPWLLRAQNAVAWGHGADAEQYLLRALQLAPNNAETRAWLARLQAQRGK